MTDNLIIYELQKIHKALTETRYEQHNGVLDDQFISQCLIQN